MMMPLVIMIILLIGIFFIASYSSDRLKSKLQYKVKYRLIIGYLVVLAGITIVYVTMIQPNLSNATYQNGTVPYLTDIIYEKEDEIGELPAEYILEEWELSPQIEEFSIKLGDGQYNSHIWMDIIVDYNDEASGRALLYETPTTISGMDISESVPLSDVIIDGDSIIVTGSNFIELNFKAIQNEMTLNQFKKDRDSYILDEFDFHHGEQVLYLELPNNVKINADEDFFNIMYK